MTPADRIVEARQLSKRYGRQLALDGVDLDVERGSIYGLIGPNGAGKTTLLSILAGLRRPSSGSVRLDVPATKRALLPDTPNFETWLTGFEVVDLARALVAPALPPERSRAVLAAAGLGEAADRRIGGYSRGMLQRLGVAASLVGESELLMLDEPCSALDPLGRREVLDLLAAQRGQRTVIFSSHILGDVQEICDSVGILRQGRLVYQGPVQRLLVGEGTPRYRVRLRRDADAVAAALIAEPWVTGVTSVGESELQVAVESLEAAESGLVGALARAEASVISLRQEEASLEQVFLDLMR